MGVRGRLNNINWRWFSYGVALCWLVVGLGLVLPSRLSHRAHSQAKGSKAVLAAKTSDSLKQLPKIDYARNSLPQFRLPPKPFKPVNCAVTACVALSFDDGPDGVLTRQIIDLLAYRGDHATFFVIGNRVVGRELIVSYAKDLGMEIGNHSWSHPDFLKLNNSQITGEVAKTHAKLQSMGIDDRLFRVPYGRRESRYIADVNLPIVYWNLDPADWKDPPADSLTANVINTARNGSLIILHDVRPNTLTALPAILDNLDSRFRVVSVSELMGWQSAYPANGFYYGR